MLDIKALLQETGLPVREQRFLGVMPLPAIVYSDNVEVGGADLKNNLLTHNIGIEFYAETIDLMNEAKIERLLDSLSVSYTRMRDWIESEKFYSTNYEFTITERK
ncbi:MAG: hypothetical protein SCM11_13295 [Bacillota bacterium]|nr:hypothetical protein [Bacillota bacterium]